MPCAGGARNHGAVWRADGGCGACAARSGATPAGGRIWNWRDHRRSGNFRRVGASGASAGFGSSFPAVGICRFRRLHATRPPPARRGNHRVQCGRAGGRFDCISVACIRIAGIFGRPDYRQALDGSFGRAFRFIFASPRRADRAQSGVRPPMGSVLEILQNVTTGTITTMLLKKGIRRSWMAGVTPFGLSGKRVVGPAFTLRFVPVREDLATPESWSKPISTRSAIEAMPENCVVVADAMGITGAGIFGDILCMRMV